MRLLRTTIALLSLVGFWGYWAELALPTTPPTLSNTNTPLTTPALDGLGSYDVLGQVVDKNKVIVLQTEAGEEMLSPEQGAVEVIDELLELRRKAFDPETFGNKVFLTDVTDALNEFTMVSKVVKAIATNGADTTWQNMDIEGNVEGIEHTYRLDKAAGFAVQDQINLIQFLLSLNGEPEVLTTEIAQR